MSADPYRGGIHLEDSQSWNKYSYGLNDPINHADPTGLCSIDGVIYPDGQTPCPNSTSTTVFGDNEDTDRDLSPPQRGAGPDPTIGQKYSNFAYDVAKALRAGSIGNDCQSLAAFADLEAAVTPSAEIFKAAFQVLTPYDPYESAFGVSWNEDPVFLGGAGAQSGYADQFRDGFGTQAGSNDMDQGHHFAAFFQLGYSKGSFLGSIAGLAVERSNWFQNQGDINLGSVAASIGARVKDGTLKTADVGREIRSALCK